MQSLLAINRSMYKPSLLKSAPKKRKKETAVIVICWFLNVGLGILSNLIQHSYKIYIKNSSLKYPIYNIFIYLREMYLIMNMW